MTFICSLIDLKEKSHKTKQIYTNQSFLIDDVLVSDLPGVASTFLCLLDRIHQVVLFSSVKSLEKVFESDSSGIPQTVVSYQKRCDDCHLIGLRGYDLQFLSPDCSFEPPLSLSVFFFHFGRC
ncbi:hypothetical protein GEMRC1_003250 [Eukaryota sp. GEM-RC1]